MQLATDEAEPLHPEHCATFVEDATDVHVPLQLLLADPDVPAHPTQDLDCDPLVELVLHIPLHVTLHEPFVDVAFALQFPSHDVADDDIELDTAVHDDAQPLQLDVDVEPPVQEELHADPHPLQEYETGDAAAVDVQPPLHETALPPDPPEQLSLHPPVHFPPQPDVHVV